MSDSESIERQVEDDATVDLDLDEDGASKVGGADGKDPTKVTTSDFYVTKTMDSSSPGLM